MILDGKRILVTGGTGSLGQVLIHRLLSGELGTPEKITLFSRDEGKQHNMRLSYLHKTISTDEVIYNNFSNLLEFRIGDIRDPRSVVSALRDTNIVINAAALKQVPTCEYFPEQAILTNCMGATNITAAIHEHNLPVERVIGVSTDKAAKPINVMGMTKAIQERIFISANILSPRTVFSCVRYGNVLASRGSVLPLFLEQIQHKKPITITHPDMTRFLLSLNEAVDIIFESLANAKSGDIYIPKPASANIINVAKALIGARNIPIEITGIRPGEKLHEVLISEEECQHTSEKDNYYIIHSMLPELQPDNFKNALSTEFSSKDTVISLPETVALLASHGLLSNESLHSASKELLA